MSSNSTKASTTKKSVLEEAEGFDEQELKAAKEENYEKAVVKEVKKLRIIKIKPVKTYNRQEGNTNGVSVLPGASLTLAPLGDGYGKIVTGIEPSEFKELMPEFSGGYSEYFKNFKVRLTAEERILDLARTSDLIIYKFLLTRSEIAKSKEEVTSQTKFILIDEEKEAEKETSKADLKFKAMTYLNDMSAEEQSNFLRLFGYSTRMLSVSVVRSKLIAVIEQNPTAFLSKYSDKNKATRMLLASLIQSDILQTRSNSVYFNEELIGASEDLAVEYLNSPRNQEMKINLIAALNAKTRV
jgi:hypothetical protein